MKSVERRHPLIKGEHLLGHPALLLNVVPRQERAPGGEKRPRGLSAARRSAVRRSRQRGAGPNLTGSDSPKISVLGTVNIIPVPTEQAMLWAWSRERLAGRAAAERDKALAANLEQILSLHDAPGAAAPYLTRAVLRRTTKS